MLNSGVDDKPIKFVPMKTPRADWFSSEIKIDGWKLVPFFVGAYRTDI